MVLKLSFASESPRGLVNTFQGPVPTADSVGLGWAGRVRF